MENGFFCGKIEDFDIIKVLKNGERGSVSVVRSKTTGERFVFRKMQGSGEVYRKLMTVSCPNLPRIISVGEENGTVSVLEEYVLGDTLYYLLEGGVLSPNEAIRFNLQLCEGLRVLHELGAVHRDIKPENIIIRGDEAVLIDFDASRMVDPEKDSDTKILGTTGYAAPEQYGLSQTDARADIYSVGVLLNVMLTGEHPSTSFVSGEMGDIIQKCTMISPEKRYQSAEELKKDLEAKLTTGKKKNSLKGILAASAAMVAVGAAVLFGIFGESELPAENIRTATPEEPADYETAAETLSAKTDRSNAITLSGWTEGTGESSLLPFDFYEYWDKSEFISAEQISLSAPGRIENYISYEFVDDVLEITVGEIPSEEWRRAFAELSADDDKFYLEIMIESPSEEIIVCASEQGNGPVYSSMKKQKKTKRSFPISPSTRKRNIK